MDAGPITNLERLTSETGMSEAELRWQHPKFIRNASLLLQDLSRYPNEDSIQTPEAERAIRDRYIVFLRGMEYEDAEEQTYDLLSYKSAENNNAKRQDETVNWYHEFGPIVILMSATVHGKENAGLDYYELMLRGGVETVICSHTDHDRIEDTPIKAEQLMGLRLEQVDNRTARWKKEGKVFSAERAAYEEYKARQSVVNVQLMTRKQALFDKDGRLLIDENDKAVKEELFETTEDYMENFLESPEANPDAYICKLLDSITNSATLLNTGRDPARLFKYLKERIDIFKSPNGMTDRAIEKWPECEGMLRSLDALMGLIVYMNMGILEHVDGFDVPDEYKMDDISKYCAEAFKMPIPRAFHPFYVLLDRMEKQAEYKPKMRKFLDEKIYPQIGDHRDHQPLNLPAAGQASIATLKQTQTP